MDEPLTARLGSGKQKLRGGEGGAAWHFADHEHELVIFFVCLPSQCLLIGILTATSFGF